MTINYDQHSDTTSYLWTIRDDIRFADGQPLTADDILFSYYIYCDPSYDGLSTISSLPILGLDNYLLQTPEDIYQKYAAMFDAAYNQGANYTIRTGDSFTQEQYALAWQLIDQAWQADLQSIIDFCLSDYLEQAKATPYTAEEITDAQNNLQVMYAMYLWSFGNLDQTGKLTGAYTGKTWNMTTDKPTLDDFLAEAKAAYGEDILAYSATETIAGEGVYSTAQKAFIRQAGTDETAAEAQNICISGIQKRSQTQVEITLAGYDAAAIYALNLCVAPLHYYGDSSKFDEQKGKFGFDFGDLSTVKAKTTQPLGAGPYKFVKYENKTVYFEANPYYYKGEPKIKYIQFKETPSGDRVSGITTGLIDITNPSFSAQTIAEISGYNSNSTLNGDKIATVTMDHLGYGYIGINAATVNVNGDPGSEASRNLRRGFATLFAAYRQLSIGSYFGEMAEVIDYPITAISWASPRKTDPAYQTAFSRDIQGNPIYSGNEDAETACRKALDAAIAYFKAADFTWDQKSGRFTAAPAGAKLEYEMVIPGEGVGDHPALILCTKAAEALATIGFNLIVTDPSDENALWDSMNANTQEFWCSARDCTIDPDLYQLYHSANIGIGNYANINDSMLD
ncbi:MAG: ABC transporter substrate-binding protein, partial [Clostridiales bacterium]